MPKCRPKKQCVRRFFIIILITGGICLFIYGHRESYFYDLTKLLHFQPKTPIPNMVTTHKTVNCKSLMEGESSEMDKAILYNRQNFWNMERDVSIAKNAKNCDLFINQRRYHTRPVSAEERDFPIAYALFVHQHVAQLEKLLRVIYRPQNVYCIHVDKKAKESVHLAVASLCKCFHNVFVASRLETIIYAGFSRLQAELNCMTDALNYGPWKYYINLASQTFPLKTNAEIVKILKMYNGANDIETLVKGVLPFRFRKSWRVVSGSHGIPMMHPSKIDKSPPPDGLTIVKGSAYGVFSRKFVEFIKGNKIAKDLLEWSRDTKTPDEHFWATLHAVVVNKKLKTPGGYVNQAVKPDKKPWLASFSAWRGQATCVSKRWMRDVCIFGVQDLPHLIHRKELFANKFYYQSDSIALDCLEELLHNKTVSDLPFDTYYYRNLPFVYK